eukprot:9097381-Karenia_brevis.AAC.1
MALGAQQPNSFNIDVWKLPTESPVLSYALPYTDNDLFDSRLLQQWLYVVKWLALTMSGQNAGGNPKVGEPSQHIMPGS